MKPNDILSPLATHSTQTYLGKGLHTLGLIEELAKSLTPPSQIAAMLNINEDRLKLSLSLHGSPERKAFLRGMAETAAEIRKNNLALARAGSPNAILSSLLSMREMINDIDN